MNKKCIVSILLFLVMLFCICSCAKDTDCVYCEVEFEKGLELGKEEMFLSLFNSICMENEEQLSSGDKWNTEHFSLVLTNFTKNEKPVINYSLTLKNSKVEDIYNQESFFFCMYGYGDDDGLILSDDEFFRYGLDDFEGKAEDYLNGNRIDGHAHLSDNTISVTIIISTKGELYSAFYYVY